MFEEYNKKFPPYGLKKASGRRVRAVKAAVFAAVGVKKNIGIKPAIIAAAAAFSVFALGTGANAASGGAVVKFLMGGEEISADIDDRVDEEGFRHISFYADIPVNEENFAVIFDIDAPDGENVRVVTDETDPDFMDKLRRYNSELHNNARKSPEEAEEENGGDEPPFYESFGLVLRDSEICEYQLKQGEGNSGGSLGGEFMHSGNAGGKPSGARSSISYDYENGIKTYKHTFYYYVGTDD